MAEGIDNIRAVREEKLTALREAGINPYPYRFEITHGVAEVIAGEPSAFDVRAIPAVVYTDPQIAWCGLTEEAAQNRNQPITIQRFPWQASGRATTMGATDGLTKIIADPETQRILGVGIVGRETEGLIAEGVLAIEMGALVEDLALTVHAHPTLSETEMETAEIFLGSSTHILPKKPK